MRQTEFTKTEDSRTSKDIDATSAIQAQVGLTVVEILIAFSVIAIIFVLAAPRVSSLVKDQYIKSAGSDLFAGLSMAKQEAEMRHSTVRMCPSSDGTSCTDDGDWSKGWLVYTDGNANGIPDDIERIKAFAAPSHRVRIYASGAVTDTASFTVAGLSPNKESDTGSFKVCHADSTVGYREISVDRDGWAGVARRNAPCNSR